MIAVNVRVVHQLRNVSVPYLIQILFESVTRRCLRVDIFAAEHYGVILHNYGALLQVLAKLP